MKLKVLDQISISAIQADSLRPRQEIVVSKAVGDDLLKAHPTKFEVIGDDEPEPKPEPEVVSAKKASDPKNKVEKDPPNKAEKAADKAKTKAADKAKTKAA